MKKAYSILLKASAVLLLTTVIIAAGSCIKKSSRIATTAQVDSQAYEVLEPQTWVGKELPILEYIDIGDKLKAGNWLVLFYHYDCPDCISAISKYEQISKDLVGNDDFLKIAFIEVPPYGRPIETNCLYGRLLNAKEWFITTPTMVLLENGTVRNSWEEKAPEMDTVLQNIAMLINQKPHKDYAMKGGAPYRF